MPHMQENAELMMSADAPGKSGQSGYQYDLGEVVTLRDMVRSDHFDAAPQATKNKIVHENAYGLVVALSHSVFYTIILSSISLVVLWSSVPHGLLIAWDTLLVTCAVARHLICLRFEKMQPSGPQLQKWLRWLWITSFLVGATWCGVVALVWQVSDANVVAFATCLLASLAFGSYAGMGQYIKIYLSSMIVQIMALGALFSHIFSGSALVAVMCMLLLFVAGMWNSSVTSHRFWKSIMTFLHKHQDLARQYRENSAVLSTILHSIGDGVLTVDCNGLVTYLNPAAERLTGLALQDVVGKAMSEGFMLTDEAADGQPVNLALVFKQVREALRLPGELVLTSVSVRAVSVEVTISPLLYSSETDIDGYVVTLHDVTLQRLSVRELSKQALQDPLTGLLNRRGFERRLHEALESKIGSAKEHCLCYIDLDRFKLVNDTCGHQAGDELLKQIVIVMQARMRDSDMFARLGGDEFALLLLGCPIDKAQTIADAICREVADYRFKWEGGEFSIGASIGIVPMMDGDSLKSLTEAADAACYRAKENGRGRVWVDGRGMEIQATLI